jgi:hypothetical protein
MRGDADTKLGWQGQAPVNKSGTSSGIALRTCALDSAPQKVMAEGMAK